MSNPDAFGYTIFCDDIRFELGGKLSFMGVYQAVMYVHEDFPTSIPKLVLSIHYSEKLGSEPKPTSIQIFMPGDRDEQPGMTADLPVDDIRKMPVPALGTELGLPPPEFLSLGMQVAFAPLQLKNPGVIRVTANRGGEKIRLGSLRVLRAPPNLAEKPNEPSGGA